MSRNKNFHTFSEPKARRALRIVRHLRDLQADVLAGASCAAPTHPVGPAGAQDGGCGDDAGADCVVVRLEYPELRATRTAYLSPQEYALLLEDPGVRSRLV